MQKRFTSNLFRDKNSQDIVDNSERDLKQDMYKTINASVQKDLMASLSD